MSVYDHLALFPLSVVLFPYVSIPLHIFEDRYKAMISDCLERDAPFGIALADQQTKYGSSNASGIHAMGTLARIEQAERLEDGRYNVTVRGESRFTIDKVYYDAPYLTAAVRPVWDTTDDPLDVQPVFDAASELFREYVKLLYSQTTFAALQMPQDAEFLSYAISAVLQIALPEKQLLLAAGSAKLRLQRSIELLKREIALIENISGDPRHDSGEQDKTRRTISRVDSSYRHSYFSRS